jgi:tyrosinase
MVGPSSLSRRHLLAGSAALAAAAALPGRARAAPAARHRRWNISDPDCPPRVVHSYKKAISAMLALPPEDPRNWYRLTLIHTLDCAHGNWWFLAWHRAYLGWFERICRTLSGDPDFALPYWDWTREPRVPAALFEDVLDPNDRAYIGSAEAFKSAFKDAVARAGYWRVTRDADLTPRPSPQYAQLLERSLRSPDDLWFDIIEDPAGPMFFAQPHARALSAAAPALIAPDAPAERQPVLTAVAAATLGDALAPRDFIAFAGPKAPAHSFLAGFGVLESQPHSLVHECLGGGYNGTGGFMKGLMSPVDPIFYLHHANIDRLWDVWARKQRAQGSPALPAGAAGEATATSDFAAWAREPFLFFVDANGDPVAENSAGAYAEIGDFDYDYAPGSGEEIVPASAPPGEVATAAGQTLPLRLAQSRIGESGPARASITLPRDLVRRQAEPRAPKLFLSVTLSVPPHRHTAFDVLLGGVNGEPPIFVASLLTFGHHGGQGPVSFLVPLSAAFARIAARRATAGDVALDFAIEQRAEHHPTAAMPQPAHGASEVTAIAIEQL